MPRAVHWDKKPLSLLNVKNGFSELGETYLHHLRLDHYSERTLSAKRYLLRQFFTCCEQQDVFTPATVSLDHILEYKHQLHAHRKADGKPMTIATQRLRLTAVKAFFDWLFLNRHLTNNPVEQLTLPKLPHQLPKRILSAQEVEQLLNLPDINTALGIRDRAMMETLYSTGMRRIELAQLQVFDVDFHRGLVMIRHGKGRKDRLIPIGQRALNWIDAYLAEGRDKFRKNRSVDNLFLTYYGTGFKPISITSLMKTYFKQMPFKQCSGCHIFRHTTATLMLDNGADIRHIQSLLGHSCLSTTQVYTQVSINKLKEVHEKTHPAQL